MNLIELILCQIDQNSAMFNYAKTQRKINKSKTYRLNHNSKIHVVTLLFSEAIF
jgi:hypothetical protein